VDAIVADPKAPASRRDDARRSASPGRTVGIQLERHLVGVCLQDADFDVSRISGPTVSYRENREQIAVTSFPLPDVGEAADPLESSAPIDE